MNRYTTYIFLGVMWLILLFGISFETYAQDCVYEPDYGNAYLNSSNPNTLEYDNIVSGSYATMVREYDGKVRVWGKNIGPNAEDIASPLELNGDNYGSGENKLTGSILKFTAGRNQYAVLTTEGLYIWGELEGLIINGIHNIGRNSFRKVSIGTYNVQRGEVKADGLPEGVQPTAVKMMFGTWGGLAIVTCDGQAWMLTYHKDGYGDGAPFTNRNSLLWHRVSRAPDTPLENVVAVRGNGRTFMALTAEGKVYTWGVRTRLGDNTGPSKRAYATLMKPIPGVTPKMIGVVSIPDYTNENSIAATYYLLGTNGRLYVLGDNEYATFGAKAICDKINWHHVVVSNVVEGETYDIYDNVAWISLEEHSVNALAINVLTKEGKLWAWGNNTFSKLGGEITYEKYATFMPGSTTGGYDKTKLNKEDLVVAVESATFFTMIIKQCSTTFGFVGNSRHGNMSDNTSNDLIISEYTFSDTSEVSVYGAVSAPILNDRKICDGSTFDLTDAIPAAFPPESTGIDWWMDANGTIPVANPEAVGPGTYYGIFRGLEEACSTAITISLYTDSDSEFETCEPRASESHFVSNPIVRQLMQNATDATEQRNQFISR